MSERFVRRLKLAGGRKVAHLANRFFVPRQNGHQVDHLAGDTELLFGHVGHLEQHVDLRAPADECGIGAAAQNVCPSNRALERILGHLFNGRSVQRLRLEYDAWVLRTYTNAV